MICDGCNVREGHAHRCHRWPRNEPGDMTVAGEERFNVCGCEDCYPRVSRHYLEGTQ